MRLDNTARVLPAPQWRGSERKTALSRALLTPFVKRKLLILAGSTPEDKRFHPLSTSDALTIPQEYCLRRRPPKSGKTARPRTHFCPSLPESFLPNGKRAPFPPAFALLRVLLTPSVKRKILILVGITPEDKPFHPLSTVGVLIIPQEYCLRRCPPESGKTARPRTHFCPSLPEIFMQERKRAPFRPPLHFCGYS